MYATNYFENQMLNLMRSQNIIAPANVYLALFLSNPGDTGTEGTEITYSGYARQAVTFSAPTASGNGLMIQNTNQVSFAEASSSAGTVTYVGVYDSLSGGNLLLYGFLDPPLVVQSGVTPIFRSNSVRWTWSGNLTTYYRTAIMNTLRGTSCSGFAPYIALCNGDPTGSGSEFSGDDYARFAVEMSAPVQQPSGAAQVSNSQDAQSNTSTGNWGQLTYVAIADAASNGNYFAVIALSTTFNMVTGSSAGFRTGNLKFNVN